MAGTGGARPGAGRPKGESITTKARRKFADYFTEEEVKQLIADIKAGMMADPNLAKFVAEQLFGKAPQRMEVSGPEGKPIPLLYALEHGNNNGDKTDSEVK